MSSLAPPQPFRAFGAGGPTLAETGEAELLRRLGEIAAAAPPADLAVPLGDDAAVWRPPAGAELAISQDALVEARDFHRDWLPPRLLGRRALQVALSDLAGMGARPAWCMATLCASGATPLEDVLEIQRGLVAAAAEMSCTVAGGDVSDTDGPLVIDVSVGGTAAPGTWLRRDAGRPGDVLLVTGDLGAAAAGVRCLGGLCPEGDARRRAAWIAAYTEPQARIAEGLRLTAAGVRCGGDISDGLLIDAGRTAAASGCAAELWLDRIPAGAGLMEAFGSGWAELALGGGEDFELLCAMPAVTASRLESEWPADLAPLRPVGRLVSGHGVRLLAADGGESLALPAAQARHWR